MGIGDWGLGIGDWGLGIGPNPQSPIPNPQSPFRLYIKYYLFNYFLKNINIKIIIKLYLKFIRNVIIKSSFFKSF